MGRAKAPNAAARDWFRSPEWDADAKADFELRLARARGPKRQQYRRIKALALLETRDPVRVAAGHGLLEQNLTDPDVYQHEKTSALCLLGAYEQDAGDLDAAEGHLRAALRMMESSPSGGTQLEEVRLAEILIQRGGPASLEEARRLLDQSAPPLLLSDRFRKCVAGVRVAIALGDEAGAAEWARLALRLASATDSGLANHRQFGLVETTDATRAWLAEVASSGR